MVAPYSRRLATDAGRLVNNVVQQISPALEYAKHWHNWLQARNSACSVIGAFARNVAHLILRIFNEHLFRGS